MGKIKKLCKQLPNVLKEKYTEETELKQSLLLTPTSSLSLNKPILKQKQ